MTIAEKQVARTLSKGSLKHDPLITSGADVVGAMAFTSKLGSMLWRVKWGNDKGAVRPTAILLSKKLRRSGEASRYILRLAMIALQEYVDTRCHHCKGRGHVINADKVVSSCTHCEGTGIARISDQRRMRTLGCNEHAYHQKWKQRLEQAHSMLSEHDSDTGHVMRKQLKEN